MKYLKLIVILTLSIFILSACKKTDINESDFEWKIELKSSYDESQFIVDKIDKRILLFDKHGNIEINFNGEILGRNQNITTNKLEEKIYFYAETIGVPMLLDGRKSVVELQDTTSISDVYFIDKIVVKAKIDRNEDEFYKFLQFYHKKDKKIYKLKFNQYEIRDVHDIVQIDEKRFIVTYEKYIKNMDNKYCIGLLDLFELVN
jgi:hypothetical protein